MALKNYRTEVAPEKTAAEILLRLTRYGAREVTQEFDGDGQLAGLHFAIETKHGRQSFRLPARWQSVQALLKQQLADGVTGLGPRHTTAAHARAVAWRLLRDWIDVQLALIDVGMVAMEEAMLPYMILPETGETLYEAFVERGVPRAAVESGANVIALPAPRRNR